MTIQPLYPAILGKSLKALSVVTFSTSSGVVSYTNAKRFAVSMTNAGSFRFPLKGTGAR